MAMARKATFPPVIELTQEQEEIQRVCRDFAAREIRPVAAAVDEADTQVPWETWHKAAGLPGKSPASHAFCARKEFGQAKAVNPAHSKTSLVVLARCITPVGAAIVTTLTIPQPDQTIG